MAGKAADNAFVMADGLVKRFGERTVIDDLSFSVREGEITGLLGPNGSGKTTVVRLLNGVLRPNSGSIAVAGLDPMKQGDEIRALSGVLTESADFYRHMSGLDNLLFFGRLYGIRDERRSEQLLDMFGLGPHKQKAVGTYSTGMRKRLGLAKALLHRPKMLFLDEPTNGLDPEGVRLVLGHIQQLNEQFGTTILICSHLLNQMEAICHRYLFIDEGRLIEAGGLAELRERHRQKIDVEIEVDDVPRGGEIAGGSGPGSEMSKGGIRDGGLIGPATFRSVSDGTIGAHRILCSVESKADIPQLLATLVKMTSVYSAHVIEPDLETLYFKVRGEGEHS